MYRNVVQSMVFFSSDLLSHFLGLCKNWTGLQLADSQESD